MMSLDHPKFTRRDMLQAGAIGLMGLSMADILAMRAATQPVPNGARLASPKSVIYIFLSGGLAQHDSFDPKPDAPDMIRGEFAPIRTRIPGVLMSEHLPKLAERIDKWAMVRSLTHPSNDHSPARRPRSDASGKPPRPARSRAGAAAAARSIRGRARSRPASRQRHVALDVEPRALRLRSGDRSERRARCVWPQPVRLLVPD